jgi:hypothetical protein
MGVKKPRVSTRAALLAGYGGKSWCALRANQSAENMARYILAKPEARQYLASQGLTCGWNGWTTTAPDAGEPGAGQG